MFEVTVDTWRVIAWVAAACVIVYLILAIVDRD